MPPTDSRALEARIYDTVEHHANSTFSYDGRVPNGYMLALEQHRQNGIEKVRIALSAAPQSDGWRPISDAPEGVLLVVGWLDPEDTEHPERHDFDYLEDGVWQQHSNNVEHFDMCAPPGSRGPSNEAPYTHFMRVAAIPTTQTEGQSHGQ
jgi:hypothetical protein